jgi:DNA polymerase V
MKRTGSFICIDLKSFYASVECVARGLDPLRANLVVADESRTDKTICLAVSPSLKAYGIPGRARLFEVKQRLQEVKAATGEEVHFITAVPRMGKYIQVSADIYALYLKYIAPEDIHVYSIDEVFIDASKYLKLYKTTAWELAVTLIREVLNATGITATAGIGTNLYLAKIAMDIVAKHEQADADGVRIAALDEDSYKALLWDHRPLTDFWQIGSGITRQLEKVRLYTMGDIARCSLGGPTDYYNEDLLFKLFGVNAELLIDHAWGVEPCTMADIKRYRPSTNSTGTGQVLQEPYSFEKGKLIVREMTEQLVLTLVDQHLVTDAIVLHIGYDRESLEKVRYTGIITTDHYGRRVPKSAHGTANLGAPTASTRSILQAVLQLFDEIVDPSLLIRRVNVTAIRVLPEDSVPDQLDLFSDQDREKKEKSLQRTILQLQRRYGKNTVLKGHDLQEGATLRDRNNQIGGHRK